MKEPIKTLQNAMSALDTQIWRKYYPQQQGDDPGPAPDVAHIWLRADIVAILTDDTFDALEVEEEILKIIKESEHGTDILNEYLQMDDIRQEVSIRRDYRTALKNAKSGSDIANMLHYSLGKDDLRKLAKLHKAAKSRVKIEDLLTACNFHSECAKFARKEYEEFLCDAKESVLSE